mmetsp:Transcript_11558/g.24974  ORF Transcript_11558/g.24974 Transcript_11558/m.24974 type:complete len:373 (+) Transcript_11558:90-1208(+)
MASDPTNTLQLVPETLLKKRHDLDQLRAKRAAAALTNPLIPRKRVSDKSKVVRVIRPETILIQARHRRNYDTRFKRVQKKGMQKRAEKKCVTKVKVWNAEKEEEVDEKELEKQRLAAEAAAAAAAAAAAEEENSDDEESQSGREEEVDDKGMVEDKTDKNKTSKKVTAKTDPIDITSQYQKIPYKANSVGASTVFAILLRPTAHDTPKTVKKTLSSLRLRRVREGVFLPYTEAVRKMLHLVEPYVLYGVPSLETISDLVRRRGFCRIEGKRVPLADNNVIEKELGDLGLICVEDLVQVLSKGGLDGMDMETAGGKDRVGEQEGTFFKVARFLWPFRMTSRKSKFQRRMLDLKDGKLYGDQGEAINGYIREML